jgi:5,5'-dehydrodivanillate O-demethylase
MRRYWHPIAASGDLVANPVKAVRILCEDLVLFRDKSGGLGLIDDRCPHRLVKLEFGYPVEAGLRCPYHGWTFDGTGACIAQPAEPPESTFKDKIHIKSYPVQELCGIVFAYLGPAPAPLLPRWEPLVLKNTARVLYFTELPCNWLQSMENSPDITHLEWLHGHFGKWVLEQRGVTEDDVLWQNMLPNTRQHKDYSVERWKFGLLRRRVLEGQTHEDGVWTIGQPMMMPNVNLTSSGGPMLLVWRVPLDDTHTMNWTISCIEVGTDPQQETIPHLEVKLKDEQGNWNLQIFTIQDAMAFVAQGEIMDRTQERLGVSDAGIILYRQVLLEQMDLLESGGEPLCVFRDPAENETIELPIIREGTLFVQDGKYRKGAATNTFGNPDSPVAKALEELAARGIEAASQTR